MTGLADAVQGVAGQPSSVRVGVVESVSPPVITAQGVPFDDVGLLSSFLPLVGNPVVLLGQSSETGSDPASWVALGAPSSSGLRILSAMGNSTYVITGAYDDIPGATATFTTTLPQTQVQLWSYADCEVVLANIATAVIRPAVNGVQLGSETQIICESPVAAAGGRWTLAGRALFTLTPGTHAVTLQARIAVGVAGTIQLEPDTTGFMMNVHG